MITRDEIEKFLSEFHTKMRVYGVVFIGRDKNLDSLAELDITGAFRESVLADIKVEDYSEGPIPDTIFSFGSMWVFGKDVKGQEVYIKISLGRTNKSTVCISFHIAEHPMNYPFKV